MNEAQVVLDSLEMGQSWHRAYTIMSAMFATEREAAREGRISVQQERSRRDRAEGSLLIRTEERDHARADVVGWKLKVGGRFWIGFGVGVGLAGAAVGVGALVLK